EPARERERRKVLLERRREADDVDVVPAKRERMGEKRLDEAPQLRELRDPSRRQTPLRAQYLVRVRRVAGGIAAVERLREHPFAGERDVRQLVRYPLIALDADEIGERHVEIHDVRRDAVPLEAGLEQAHAKRRPLERTPRHMN